MVSKPPAMTTSLKPAAIDWAAKITAFMLEASDLLMREAGMSRGKPAVSAACLAGFCPRPALRAFPRMISSIY